jgi:hypothetical protein
MTYPIMKFWISATVGSPTKPALTYACEKEKLDWSGNDA